MVQLMKSGSACMKVKLEFDGFQEDQLGPLQKRSRIDISQQQWSSDDDSFSLPSSTYSPLDEPSPLGLRLKKSPSLLDLIQMKLSQASNLKAETVSKKDHKGSKASGSADNKLKASNFPASILRIGTWEYKSRHEGDLVAKCYFAKHKLVWEVLDGCLKNKIEIQWSDIMALKANYPDDGPGTLDIVLARRPSFFRETNPQPRKHTLWQVTSDFTDGQASIHRRHFLQCPTELLGKHFEKLIQCDPRLNFLSQQPEIVLDCPYYESRAPVFDDLNEHRNDHPCLFGMHEATLLSGSQSTSSRDEPECSHKASESDLQHITSPSSVMAVGTAESFRGNEMNSLRLNKLDQIKLPGIHPSMSMTDLASHIDHYISEQMTSSNPAFPGDSQISKAILEDISQCLFNESQLTSASNEQYLMSRVNSLCCLLQTDPSTAPNAHIKSSNLNNVEEHGMTIDKKLDDACGSKQTTGNGMSRKESIGELLMHLPRIASLPQFLFNLSEGSNGHVR